VADSVTDVTDGVSFVNICRLISARL